MKILIIFKEVGDVAGEISEFKRKLVAIDVPAHILPSFPGGRSTDLQVVIISQKPNLPLNPEQQKLLEHSDFTAAHFRDLLSDNTFKIIKDKKKSVVRDVDTAGLFFTLGKYYAFDYAERNPSW
jgi:hypothetical protein